MYGIDGLRIAGAKNEKGELIIVVSNVEKKNIIAVYKQRWEIEVLFSALKKRGFNLEETHLADRKKITLLFGLISLSFVWSYFIGILKAKKKPIDILKHEHKEQSFFMYGLMHMKSILLYFYEKVDELANIFEIFIGLISGENPDNMALCGVGGKK